jgi:hypothetical protein
MKEDILIQDKNRMEGLCRYIRSTPMPEDAWGKHCHIATIHAMFDLYIQYKKKNPSYSVDLSNADLRGIDFKKLDLSNANLYGANLQGASLLFTNLDWANLGKADLSQADLSCARMKHAYINGASLKEAKLRRAKIYWVRFNKVDLSGTEFNGVDFFRVRFYDVILDEHGKAFVKKYQDSIDRKKRNGIKKGVAPVSSRLRKKKKIVARVL